MDVTVKHPVAVKPGVRVEHSAYENSHPAPIPRGACLLRRNANRYAITPFHRDIWSASRSPSREQPRRVDALQPRKHLRLVREQGSDPGPIVARNLERDDFAFRRVCPVELGILEGTDERVNLKSCELLAGREARCQRESVGGSLWHEDARFDERGQRIERQLECGERTLI